jgi:hypothetical protein
MMDVFFARSGFQLSCHLNTNLKNRLGRFHQKEEIKPLMKQKLKIVGKRPITPIALKIPSCAMGL